MWRPVGGGNPEARQKIAEFFGAPKADNQQQNVTAPKTAKKPRIATPGVVRPRRMGPMGPGRIQAAQIAQLAQQRARNSPPPGDLAGSS